MGADLICVQHWEDDKQDGAGVGVGRPSRNGGPRVLPMENFGNVICQTVTFCGICVQ